MMLQFNFTWFILFLLFGCNTESEKKSGEDYTLPKGYSLESVKKVILNQDLDEISGIAWDKEMILGIEDESAIIFRLDAETGKIQKKQKFGKNTDIEDILIRNETAWVLRSNGNLYQVTNFFTDSVSTKIHEFPVKESQDLEGIASPEDEPIIYVFCKVCEWDEGPEKASVFSFSLESMEFDPKPHRLIHRSQLKDLLPKKWEGVKMQPSAAAYHPLTGELYIISSTGKWLMTMDREWNPTTFHPLHPGLFKQPEGITFDDLGNLFISNEAASGTSNWLFFPYQK